jgi:hypothetical protein
MNTAMRIDPLINTPGIERATAYSSSKGRRVPSNLAIINRFLEGGFPQGSVVEWGQKTGQGARRILSTFVAHTTTHQSWCLWVSGHKGMSLYPPSLQAAGIDLDYLRICYSRQPFTDIHPVLLDGFFKFIIFDGVKISNEQFGQLHRLARQHQSVIITLQEHLISDRQNNVWARIRLNSWQESINDRYGLNVIRGLSPRHLTVTQEAIDQSGFINKDLNLNST